MNVALLDVNVLLALAWPNHAHHECAHRWFNLNRGNGWATCPITQSGFVRLSCNPKVFSDHVRPFHAIELLRRVISYPGHEFWNDDLSMIEALESAASTLMGHRQITDAYLAALATHHGGKLATLDSGVAALTSRTQLQVELIR